MSVSPFLTLESATFGYRKNGPPVVSDISFSAAPGDFLVLRGPNGCGKSTIVKGLLGLAFTLGGTIRWNLERTDVGYVPQESAVAENIPFTALDIVKCADTGGDGDTPARTALERIGMDDKRSIRFGDLSGGQKRRVLFARALVRRPRMLVLDEPTANVDLQSESIIEALINEVTAHNDAAVIAVAHATDFGSNARVIPVGNGAPHG
ncbi:MAG: ATP-binding cassette domain-containing protein [Chitinispirillaceae bacterium]|nr:ATP-binding cassette domain-containing protein [Chitinispirillaceae bacterium]